MKSVYTKISGCLFLVMACKTSLAQNAPVANGKSVIFTADSMRSGNSKDVLTSFFQLAFNNLTGKNKEFNFQSNPFAVMLRSNPKLNIDHYYSKYTALRKLNFGFGVKLDTAYRFSGFSSGIKYALIDGRDYTTSKLFAANFGKNALADERRKLNAGLQKMAQARFNASSRTPEDRKVWDEYRTKITALFSSETPFASLDETFKADVQKVIKESGLQQIEKLFTSNPQTSLRAYDVAVFNALKDSIKQCALWTVGISDTTYTNQFAFSNVVLSTQFAKGVFAPRGGANNVELNIKANTNFLKDTAKAGNNLKRILLDAEAGLNWVIRDRENKKSWMELMLSATYYRNLTSLYQNEERSRLTVNGTARLRLFDDIWVPLEIKYDPANGNLFGLVNVKFNFTALGSLVKGLRQ
jgi:hypothetical protein